VSPPPDVSCLFPSVAIRHPYQHSTTIMSISSRSGSSAASVRSYASSIPSLTPIGQQDADILPSYTSLFPNQTTSTNPDTANLMRDRRDIPRYTTITLREIRFPSGCPCHPKTVTEGREALRREQIAMARAACDRQQHSPPSIVTSSSPASDTRSPASLTNRSRTTSSSSTSSTRTTHPATTANSRSDIVNTASKSRRLGNFLSRRVSGTR
jgi:hypothetical protein